MQDIGHYIAIPDALMLVPTSILKHQARMLWGAIHDRQGDNASAWPSIKTLGFEAGIARGEVTKYLNQLVDLDLIEKVRGQTTNRYRVKLPPILVQAARDVKALPPKAEGGFDVDAAERIAVEATKRWLATLGHHESIKLPLAGTPASEVPESRHPGHRNSGIADAGVPARNHSKSSPMNHPKSAPTPASPPTACGGTDQDAPLGRQTPVAKTEPTAADLSKLVTALRVGLGDKRRTDQLYELAGDLHTQGATPAMIGHACQMARLVQGKPLTSRSIHQWQDWAYMPAILDDSGKSSVCSSAAAMKSYLTSGPGWLDWQRAEGYAKDSPNTEAWTIGHFVGFYWYTVAWYAERWGQDVMLPHWGTLVHTIRSLLVTNTKPSLYLLLRSLVGNFHVLRYWLRNSSVTIALNERTPTNGLVIEKLTEFHHLSPAEREELRERAEEWAVAA